MKWKELKIMQTQELNEKRNELSLELMKERAQVAIGTVPKSPGKLRYIRKTIARMNSLLGGKKQKP